VQDTAGLAQREVQRRRLDALELAGEDGVQPVVLARLDDERQLRQPRPERFHVSIAAASVGHGRCVLRARPVGR
jgi:hypothetical protein